MFNNDAQSSYEDQLIDISDCNTLQQINEKAVGILDKAEKVSLYHSTPQEHRHHIGGGNSMKYFGNHVGLRNERTHQPYGTCKDGYEVIQNSQAFKSLENIVTAGEATFDKAALFNNGASSFINIKTQQADVIYHDALGGHHDPVNNNLFALNDQSATSALTFGSHAVRLFCLNQLPTISSWLKGQIKFRHTISAKDRLYQIQELMYNNRHDFQGTIEAYDMMGSTKMSTYKFYQFAEELLNKTWGPSYEDVPEVALLAATVIPQPKVVTKPKRLKTLEQLTTQFESGNQGAGSTQWGALQTITAWVDHNPKISFLSNLKGASKTLKDNALTMLGTRAPTTVYARTYKTDRY